ncbi:hypothetical protein WA158_001089 [Blastocystis sp. Blastoise]
MASISLPKKGLEGVKLFCENAQKGSYKTLNYSINLASSEIDDEGLHLITNAFKKDLFPLATELILSDNPITEKGLQELFDCLKNGHMTYMLLISLNQIPLNDNCLSYINQYLNSTYATNLQGLSLDNCSLNECSIQLIQNIIKSKVFDNFLIFGLGGNSFGEKCKDIIEVLNKPNHLKKFTFHQNICNDEAMSLLIKQFDQGYYKNMNILNLSYNNMNTLLPRFLCAFNKQNFPLLKRIDLSGCFINHFINSFSDSFSSYSNLLEEIILKDNSIDEEGLPLLLSTLQKNVDKQIRVLDISWNDIGDEGAKLIVDFFGQPNNMPYLKVIFIAQNSIGSQFNKLASILTKRKISTPAIESQWL